MLITVINKFFIPQIRLLDLTDRTLFNQKLVVINEGLSYLKGLNFIFFENLTKISKNDIIQYTPQNHDFVFQ
jgi:hypothetical protein